MKAVQLRQKYNLWEKDIWNLILGQSHQTL